MLRLFQSHILAVSLLAGPASARLGEPAAPTTATVANVTNETGNASSLLLPQGMDTEPSHFSDDSDELLRLETELQELERVNSTFDAAVMSLGQSDLLAGIGAYGHLATTTRYGDSPKSACGGLSTSQLVKGTRWYQVASSQSMQGGSCCYCQGARGGGGTVGLGCLSCAKGRFLRSGAGPHARSGSEHGFASGEIYLIVADICPANRE